MATSIRAASIARDVADLMKANRRVGGAIAASQVPLPAKDRLVIATNGQPATWQLSALPYLGDLGSSLNLSLNGQELDEATDYSVDYTTGLVTFSAGQQALFKATPTPADVLTADYLTSDDLIAAAQPADTGNGPAGYIATASAGNSGITSLTSGMPTGFAAGDLLLAALTTNVGPTTPSGWTLLDHNGILYLYTRTADGTETTVTWSLGGTGSAQSKIRAYRGTSGVTVDAHAVNSGLTSPSVTASGAYTQVTEFAAQQTFTTGSITADPAMTHTDGGGNTVTYMIGGDEAMSAAGPTPTRTGTIGGGTPIDYESATIIVKAQL